MTRLFAAERVPMVHLATLLVGSVAVAEEVVQEAFVSVTKRWDKAELGRSDGDGRTSNRTRSADPFRWISRIVSRLRRHCPPRALPLRIVGPDTGRIGQPLRPRVLRISRSTGCPNDLTGPVPPELGNLTTLEELWLDGNKLSGPVPAELGQLVNLQELNLEDNELSGSIPPAATSRT